MRFWNRNGEFHGLEDELRARRSDPSDAYVRALARHIEPDARWLPAKTRFAFVVALVTVALVAVASAGGFSAAKSTTTSAVKVVSKLTGSSSPSSTSPEFQNTPASAQYVSQCGGPMERLCTIAIFGVTKNEGNAGCTDFAFVVSITNGPNSVLEMVDYQTQNGTATAPSDYVSQSGTVLFPPGTTQQTIHICVNGDTVKEKNETFKVLLSNPGPTATITGTNPAIGTILNDD